MHKSLSKKMLLSLRIRSEHLPEHQIFNKNTCQINSFQ